jgi:hypothetical protein
MIIPDKLENLEAIAASALLNLSYLVTDVEKRPQIPDYRLDYMEYYYDTALSSVQEASGKAGKTDTRITPTVELGLEFENDDAAWVMASTFMVFTMQTGYGLIESGMCHMKNEVNILMKNVVDVALGGFMFWAVGYGIAFGEHPVFTNSFFGVGNYFFSPDVNQYFSGESYLHFFYHVALASSATTVASGSMAERCNFKAFMIFATFNVFIYCFPAHWMWADKGWLKQLGACDLAGSGLVHQIGGFSGMKQYFCLIM